MFRKEAEVAAARGTWPYIRGQEKGKAMAEQRSVDEKGEMSEKAGRFTGDIIHKWNGCAVGRPTALIYWTRELEDVVVYGSIAV